MKITLWRTGASSFHVGFTRVPESHPAAVRAKVYLMRLGVVAFIAFVFFQASHLAGAIEVTPS
ncbi:MAG: hypothetical protein ABI387_02070 [Lacunisphaera sp.]